MIIVVLFIIISVFIIVVIIIIIYDTNRWKIFEIIQLSLKSNHPTWCSTANFNHRSSDVKLYRRATKLVLSNIPLDWYSSNIFSTNPYSSNIFSTNPYSSNILSCKFHIIYTTNVYTLFAPSICHNTPPEVRCTWSQSEILRNLTNTMSSQRLHIHFYHKAHYFTSHV